MMEVVPGQGVGSLRYGMYRTDVEALLGEAELSSREQYTDAAVRDLYWSLDYFSLGLSLTFNQEDNYRLSCITLSRTGFELFGADLIGIPYTKLRTLLANNGYFTKRTERLEIEALGLVFWFQGDQLDEIQCNCLYDDAQKPIWTFHHS